jgi:prepilin-type N-terminal cleavage/methylation domain-containing protein
MRQKRPAAALDRRAGFTLVEMLVVISIIGVLVSLSAAGYFVWLGNQSQDTTETTMRQVFQVLNRQFKAVIDKADQETIPASVLSMAGGDVRRGRVIWKKLRLKQEFPISYAEARNPWQAANPTYNLTPATDLPGNPVYIRALQGAVPGPGESSACLLLALSRNRGGVRLSADDLPNTAVTDTNGDGVKEIVDAWAKPMAFFRWPTGNAELTNLNTAKFADPLDPEGLLLSPTWYNLPSGKPNPQRLQFESLCHPISADGKSAYYVIPALASGGRDMTLGLDLTTMAITNTAAAADNIYSYRLRLGARGTQ